MTCFVHDEDAAAAPCQICHTANARNWHPTPGSNQNQPAAGVPRIAPTMPPITIRDEASIPTLAARWALVVPESLIKTLGTKVNEPSSTPTRATAVRFPIVAIVLIVDMTQVTQEAVWVNFLSCHKVQLFHHVSHTFKDAHAWEGRRTTRMKASQVQR
jgi:hypothetical protein